MAIIYRRVKGSALTSDEVDDNFQELSDDIGALENVDNAKLNIDGSNSMTGDLDIDGNDVLNVNIIKDVNAQAGVFLGTTNRYLYDKDGNPILQFSTTGVGVGINTAGYFGNIKTDNLTAAKTFQLPDQNGTIALTSDITGGSFSALTGAYSDNTSLNTKIVAMDAVDALKQATLVSGTNIKTINGSSVLGSGDLTVTTTFASQSEVNAGTVSNKAIAPDTNKIFVNNTAFINAIIFG